MSATNRGEHPDPLAAALRVVLSRRGRNTVQGDELAWSRQVRDVAQVCWMQAGEPKRLRSEDADRAQVCRDLKVKVEDRGWALAEPEEVFFVAFRRGRKGWERERRVKALTPNELLAKIDALETEFQATQKPPSPTTTA